MFDWDFLASLTLCVFVIIQILFAVSPVLALGYVLFSAYESPETERMKRRKKGDFELEGHAE